jgi:hypothetical protein
MDDDGLGEFKPWIQECLVKGQGYREESKGPEARFGSRDELEAPIGEARNVGVKLIASSCSAMEQLSQATLIAKSCAGKVISTKWQVARWPGGTIRTTRSRVLSVAVAVAVDAVMANLVLPIILPARNLNPDPN